MTEAQKYLMQEGFIPHSLITNHKGEIKLVAGVMAKYAEKQNIAFSIKFKYIGGLSQQRELLLAFTEFLYEGHDKEVEARIVDMYLNSK